MAMKYAGEDSQVSINLTLSGSEQKPSRCFLPFLLDCYETSNEFDVATVSMKAWTHFSNWTVTVHQAAILQQTADYIFTLEQEKTRLLQQNSQLKRIIQVQHELPSALYIQL